MTCLSRREVSGHVASVSRARDYDEAVSLANGTPVDLSAGICTPSLTHVSHVKRHVESGMVIVNPPTAGIGFHMPFDGSKGSTYGPRKHGRYGSEFYIRVKTTYLACELVDVSA